MTEQKPSPKPDRVRIENVNHPGKSTPVDAGMYHAMREALLAVLPTSSPGMTETQMRDAVTPKLPAELFPDGAYVDVPGLCKVATVAEIEAQGWSLNPGRYVGVAAGEEDDGLFAERLAELHGEFTTLSDEAEVLRRKVDAAVRGILEA